MMHVVYRSAVQLELLDAKETETWLCCLAGDMALTVKAIAEEVVESARSVVFS